MTIEIEESSGCVFKDLEIKPPEGWHFLVDTAKIHDIGFLKNGIIVNIKSYDSPRVVKKKTKKALEGR
jgi:hypothetical protein